MVVMQNRQLREIVARKMDNFTSTQASLDVRARQNVVLCILGLLFNVSLIMVVFVSVRLRKSAKYQLVVSLSIADILLDAIYLPLDTSMTFSQGEWAYSCELMFFAYGLHEFTVPAITALTLTAVCIEYAITMFYNVIPRWKKRMVVLGVVLPWTFGLLALFPVFNARVVAASGVFKNVCASATWTIPTLVCLIGVFGYLPLALLLGALALTILSYCFRQPNERIAIRTILARSDGMLLTHEIIDTFFACVISLAFHLPFLAELVAHIECNAFSECYSPDRKQHVFEVLRTAASVFFPAVWVLGAEFRHGLFTSSKCCYKNCDMEIEMTIPR